MKLLQKYIEFEFLRSKYFFNKNITEYDFTQMAIEYFSKEKYWIRFGINLSLFLTLFFSLRNIGLLNNFLKLVDNILILIQVEKKE